MTVLIVLGGLTTSPARAAPGRQDGDGRRTLQQIQQSDALNTYLEFVDRQWPDESEQQAITVRSLRLLADAIAATAARDRLAGPPFETLHADVVAHIQAYDAGRPDELVQVQRLRQAFAAAADLISRLARLADHAEALHARLAAMHRSVESLDRALPLRRQPDVIERFFKHAGEALRSLGHH